MKPILSSNEVNLISGAKFNRHDWTVLIAAGGKGSRLGKDVVKALYPVAGRPMLDWILRACLTQVERFVVVVSPEHSERIGDFLARNYPDRDYSTVVQPYARGNADAVTCGIPSVKTKYVAVVWCDQITLQPTTLELCLKAHSARPNANLTLPSAQRPRPYVCLRRDDAGNLIGILEEREGHAMPEIGESDCGLFLFTVDILREILARREKLAPRGKETKEINLLTLLPYFGDRPGESLTLSVANADETLGVNSQQDVAEFEKGLKERQWRQNSEKTV